MSPAICNGHQMSQLLRSSDHLVCIARLHSKPPTRRREEKSSSGRVAAQPDKHAPESSSAADTAVSKHGQSNPVFGEAISMDAQTTTSAKPHLDAKTALGLAATSTEHANKPPAKCIGVSTSAYPAAETMLPRPEAYVRTCYLATILIHFLAYTDRATAVPYFEELVGDKYLYGNLRKRSPKSDLFATVWSISSTATMYVC